MEAPQQSNITCAAVTAMVPATITCCQKNEGEEDCEQACEDREMQSSLCLTSAGGAVLQQNRRKNTPSVQQARKHRQPAHLSEPEDPQRGSCHLSQPGSSSTCDQVAIVSTGIVAMWTDHACTHATAARSAMQSTHSSGSSSRLRVVLLLVVLLLLSARGARAIQRKQDASCTRTICQAGLGTEQLPSRSCRHSPPAPLTSQSLRRHPLALLHEPEGRDHGRSRRPPGKAAGSRHCGGKGELGLHGIGGAFRRVGSLLIFE